MDNIEGYLELPAKTKTYLVTPVNLWDTEYYIKVDDDIHVNIDSRQPMNLVLNHAQLINSRAAANSTWERTQDFKFSLTRAFSPKPERTGSTNGKSLLEGIQFAQAVATKSTASSLLFPSKGTTAEVFNRGAKGGGVLQGIESEVPSTMDSNMNFFVSPSAGHAIASNVFVNWVKVDA